MQPNDFSETVTSWAYTLPAMDNPSPTANTLLVPTNADIRDTPVMTWRM
jgi:hypothetical protein